MIPEQHLRKIQDRLSDLRSKPTVSIFIDLDSVLEDLNECMTDDVFENLRDQDIADGVIQLAQATGKPAAKRVYYTESVERNDGIEREAWDSIGAITVYTPKEVVTREGINMNMLFDCLTMVEASRSDIAILVTGQTNYTALARQLIDRGVMILMVGNYPREQRVLPRGSCVYVPMRSLLLEREQLPMIDTESYDFRQFVRLLSVSESMMPFVGVRYFIHKVMWRLGNTFHNKLLCQQLFQAAKEKELVEVYKCDNVDEAGKPVSACRLNMNNTFVIETLKDADQATALQTDDGMPNEHFDETSNIHASA